MIQNKPKIHPGFEMALRLLTEQILLATGIKATGQRATPPRLPGFVLTEDIKTKIGEAIQTLGENNPEKGIQLLEAALEHLRNKEAVYAKSQLPSMITELMVKLTARTPGNRVLDPIYILISQIEIHLAGRIDLDLLGNEWKSFENTLAEAHRHLDEAAKKQREESARKAESFHRQAERNRAAALYLQDQLSGLLVR